MVMPTPPTTFVGRQEELRQLHELMLEGAQSRGELVFLEGDPGMGKSSLLNALRERAHAAHQLQDVRFLKTTCPAFLGMQSPYEPFVEILQTLTHQDDQRREIAKLVVTVLKETGSDWLAVIPGLGPALGAAVKTATVVGKHLLDLDDEKGAELSKVLTAQYVSMIAKVSEKYAPLVLIVEDAHWIDSASCELLLRLGQKAADLPLLVLVTYAPSFLSEQHPLQQIRLTMQRSLLARIIPVRGWDEVEIDRYVQARYGSSVHPRLAAWLADLTKGSPEFVLETLTLLERDKVIQHSGNAYALAGDLMESVNGWELRESAPHFTLPENLRVVLEHRIGRLTQEDREMLALGAVQGQRFRSSILVELLNRDEMDVLNRLGSIEEQHRMIRFYADEMSPDETFDVYAFEHGAMQRQFYQSVREPIRARYHERIATILERMLLEQASSSRRLILGTAYHYARARKRLPAARYFYRGAESAYASGAFAETIDLCARALEHVRLLPEGVVEHDRLRAEIILLLITASEVRWRGRPELYGRGSLPLANLVDEAEAAAARTGAPPLVALAQFLKGVSLVATRSLAQAEAAMRQALETARAANDPLLEFSMLPHLGNIVNSQDLGAGIAFHEEALELYEEKLAAAHAHSPTVQRHYYRLQGFIGVGEFDRGNYGAAVPMLRDSIAGLKRLKMHADLPRMLNYLGQVYAAMGLFIEAEQTIRESFAHFDEGVKSPWHGYNQAFFGKVYLEWGRVVEAVEPLRQGWEETQLTWNVDLAQLVRTYFAQLLMDRRFGGHDLGEAERLLRATVDESRAAAIHHSEIAALSLLGRLALVLGDVVAAVDWSSQAVERLLLKGALPALRVEEVHFAHFRVMQAAGRETDARDALERAHGIIQEKARSIQDESHRRSFLGAVPLSREILDAWSAQADSSAVSA